MYAGMVKRVFSFEPPYQGLQLNIHFVFVCVVIDDVQLALP